MIDIDTKNFESLLELNKDMNKHEFDEISETKKIGIVYDYSTLSNENTLVGLKIAINMLSRLYSNIGIFSVNNEISQSEEEFLFKLSRSIRPTMHFFDCIQESDIIVNYTQKNIDNKVSVFINSSNWDIEIGRNISDFVLDDSIPNPIAACTAATLGVGEVFKEVFPKIKSEKLDYFRMSLFDYSDEIKKGPILTEVNIGEVLKVGIGAIGNAFIYGLSELTNLSGKLILIDDEFIDNGNTQRYLLSNFQNINSCKVNVARDFLSKSKCNVEVHRKKLGEYFYKSDRKSSIENIVISVDNYETRVHAQALLPKNIFNAYTGNNGQLGVTSHKFGDGPCLACLYTHKNVEQSEIEEIADWLGVDIVFIGNIMINHSVGNKPILTRELAEKIVLSSKKNLTLDDLEPFIAHEFRDFTTKAMCGGILLMSEEKIFNNTHSPICHQSVLSGLLLANELIKFSISKNDFCNRKQIMLNVLYKPNLKYISREAFPKLKTCICTDPIYLDIYKKKYVL